MTTSLEQPLEEIILPDAVDRGEIGPEAGTEALQTDSSESHMNNCITKKWDTEGQFTCTITIMEKQQQKK